MNLRHWALLDPSKFEINFNYSSLKKRNILLNSFYRITSLNFFCVKEIRTSETFNSPWRADSWKRFSLVISSIDKGLVKNWHKCKEYIQVFTTSEKSSSDTFLFNICLLISSKCLSSLPDSRILIFFSIWFSSKLISLLLSSR